MAPVNVSVRPRCGTAGVDGDIRLEPAYDPVMNDNGTVALVLTVCIGCALIYGSAIFLTFWFTGKWDHMTGGRPNRNGISANMVVREVLNGDDRELLVRWFMRAYEQRDTDGDGSANDVTSGHADHVYEVIRDSWKGYKPSEGSSDSAVPRSGAPGNDHQDD